MQRKKKGLSPLQKCTAAIRQLAYGAPADHYNEYLRIGEKTSIKCVFNFCRCVIEVFGTQYLRKPNATDIQRLLQMHDERHGFPGMLGSLDCMHWEWKNCPVAWKCQFTRGSRNDINVLNESPLFNNVLQDMKRKKFKERQETARKDVERIFGILQSCWAIVRGPCRFWYKNKLKDIMLACIILHNMIIEDEGDTVSNWSDEDGNDPPAQINQGSTEEFREYKRRNCELRDNQSITHFVQVYDWGYPNEAN
ncbi:uncharacterized protein [Henckelia pumila]|uniref:uncharacterized protein n=1 Tax=Henckelia pumila TaxID=405737 RepID=UPI003C6E93CB